MPTSVLDFFKATLSADPVLFLEGEELLETSEWDAIKITDGNGQNCAELILATSKLLAFLKGTDNEARDTRNLIRVAIIAVDNQIWNGGPPE